MSDQTVLNKFRDTVFQLARFSVVGVTNTLVDFAVVNLLVVLFSPESIQGLAVATIVACGVATLNSYILNRRWTFRRPEGGSGSGSAVKFFAIAGLSMLVNSSVFLFCIRYMPERLDLSEFWLLNLAKLAGVVSAFLVSFLGYRFGVFQTETVGRFRHSFKFEISQVSFWKQVAVLVGVSSLARVGYLLITSAVFGDAVNYAWVASSLAAGEFERVDPFWSSLYCFWQALFHISGMSMTSAAITASLIPGILLVIPVVWIARSLYEAKVAWLAGAFMALHPRLIEYSINGYAESFYILAFTMAVAALIWLLKTGSYRATLAFGAFFGLYIGTRSEAVVPYLASLGIIVCAYWLRRRPTERSIKTASWLGPATIFRGRRSLTALIALSILAVGLVTGAYVALSEATLGMPGIFQKTTNLGKQFSEQLDFYQAARETYASNGEDHQQEKVSPSLFQKATTLLKRLPRNWLYTLERLPGVLLSPLSLFVLLLPVFTRRRSVEELPLLLMLAFPLGFYPVIQVEPRLLFPILIPVNIFGAAGLVAFSRYASSGKWKLGQVDGFATRLSKRFGMNPLLYVTASGLLLMSFSISAWRGADVERDFDFHRHLSGWIKESVSTDELIVGCGYGYVSTTGFLSAHRTVPRLWTEDSSDLVRFMADCDSRWLIIYEAFLRRANPELMKILETGIPGLERVYEVVDHQGMRTQVFERLVL